MRHRAVRCQECAERGGIARRRRGEALGTWEASVPGRYAWVRGFDAPELAERVHAEAVTRAKVLGAKFDRVALLGNAGAGKTVIGVALLHAVANAGTRVAFVEARTLASARAQHGLGMGEAPDVRDAIAAPVAAIDDIGSEAQTPQSAVTDVIHARHAAGRPTIFTCALDVDATRLRYGDGVARRMFEGASIIPE